MLACTIGLIWLNETTSFESVLPGICVDESLAAGGVFVLHPFV
jgi:hypothetical protein